jgi:hypothetical protein
MRGGDQVHRAGALEPGQEVTSLSSTDAPPFAPTAAVARGAPRSAHTDEPIDADEDREDHGRDKVAVSFVDEFLRGDLDQRIERRIVRLGHDRSLARVRSCPRTARSA